MCSERQSSNCRSRENKIAQKALSSDLLSQDCSKGSGFLATALLPQPALKAPGFSSHSTLISPYSSFFCYDIWRWLE